jgi:hypothetical protein
MTTFWGVSLSISLATSVAPLHTAKVGVEFVMSKAKAAKQLTKYLRPLFSLGPGGCGTNDSAQQEQLKMSLRSSWGHSVVRHPVSLKTTLLADHMCPAFRSQHSLLM